MTPDEFEQATGKPLAEFAHQCHAASVALVRSGVYDLARVARGTCPGVGGQHSWVVLGDDCYDPDVHVVDPTLWSYTGEEPYVWTGSTQTRPHRPHGLGSIWQWGRPEGCGGEPVTLEGLSDFAQSFVDMLGPLDVRGWAELANAPVLGWPAAEIIAAMDDHPVLKGFVPIDRLGMLTDRNPNGLYLPVAS